jgi:flagellar hook protein FlgE
MGIQSAMYSGVSGLNANSQDMSVIGNNLANGNTLGFKASRTVFSDLLSSNVTGSGGSSQVGRGVGLSSVDDILSQGTFETTSSDTDVAIEGSGFFVLKEPGNDTNFYSRAGAFSFDGEGYLVNPEGYIVQGKLFDPVANDSLLPIDPTDIQVANVGLVPANATSTLTFTTNLNENSLVIPTQIAAKPIITGGAEAGNTGTAASINAAAANGISGETLTLRDATGALIGSVVVTPNQEASAIAAT